MNKLKNNIKTAEQNLGANPFANLDEFLSSKNDFFPEDFDNGSERSQPEAHFDVSIKSKNLRP